MPWIGPESKSERGRAGGFRLATAFLRELAFLRDTFFLLGFFFETFFFDDFFAGFFFEGFFLLADFFFEAVDFLDVRFFDGDFFRVTLRLLAAFFFEAAFFDATFFRDEVAFFRFLLAVLLAGISNSCRTEKRRGLYIACPCMEAHFSPVFGPDFRALRRALQRPAGRHVFFRRQSS